MARGGLIAALAGVLLLAHGASALIGAFERKSLGSRFTPSHGEITHVPGFEGPLPSKCAAHSAVRRRAARALQSLIRRCAPSRAARLAAANG